LEHLVGGLEWARELRADVDVPSPGVDQRLVHVRELFQELIPPSRDERVRLVEVRDAIPSPGVRIRMSPGNNRVSLDENNVTVATRDREGSGESGGAGSKDYDGVR
jgi:hypothetical protein